MVGDQLTHLVLNVLAGQDMSEGFSDTFLTLIPKVSNPQLATQLRPIGLSNMTYKVVPKVLVNRINIVLDKIIAPTQSGFVPGQQITDNIVIVQEMLHLMHRKQGNLGYIAIKLDLEKAYGKLKWPFI